MMKMKVIALLTCGLIRSRDGGRVDALGDQFSNSFLLIFSSLYLPLQFVKSPAVCGVVCSVSVWYA
jgi:hypothetical protein